MKLSQISTDKAFDVLCELTEPLANISADTNLLKNLRIEVKKDSDKPLTPAQRMMLSAKKITQLAPILLKTHKKDIAKILAVLNDTTVEAILKQNALVTMTQIKEVVEDEELIAFFKSCTDMEESE